MEELSTHEQIMDTQEPGLELSQTEIISIDILCRLCANHNERVIGIYSEEGISNDLANKMNLYLPIKVSEHDSLPLHCCWSCASTVLAWHELVVASVEADRRLRGLVEKGVNDIYESPISLSRTTRNIQIAFKEIQEERKRLQLDGKDESKTKYVCQECLKVYHSESLLMQHFETCNVYKILAEDVENKPETNTRVDKIMEEIFGDDEENTVYVCSECEMGYQSEAKLDLHFALEHSKYKCNVCDTACKNSEDLEEHKAVHVSEDIEKSDYVGYVKLHDLQCEICEKVLNSRAGYLGHLKIHVSDFCCPVCCNSYVSKFKLDIHLATHVQSEIDECVVKPRYVQCDAENCEKQFPSKLQLYNHKKKHSTKLEYACDVCGMTFVRETALKSHKLKHDVVMICEYCNKVFANKKTLTEHIRLHTGELPYTCKICDMKFRCHSGLKYHETTHSTEKKYKCSHCLATFARSNYLKEHIRKHMNEKPFSCNFCNQKFIQPNILKRHIANMHRTCGLCNEMVGNIRDARAHIWKKHQDIKQLLDVGGTLIYVDNASECVEEEIVMNQDCGEDVEEEIRS